MNSGLELTAKTKDLDETTLLQNQTVGQFHVRTRGADGAPPISTRQFVTDTNLLTGKSPWLERNEAQYMSVAEWEETVQQQLDAYYRPVSGASSSSPPTASSAPQSQQHDKPADKAKLDPGRGYK